MKQKLNRALVTSEPSIPSNTPRKRPTFRPREGWLVYNLNRQVDQSVILARFVAIVDALPEEDVWAHYTTGNPGTCPRLVLKLLAVKFLFCTSSARALGLAEILRPSLAIGPHVRLPCDATLDYRLRSGALAHLLDALLEGSLELAEDDVLAIDSTGLADRRAERRQWSDHGKRHPKAWRKVHLVSGTRSHAVYALSTTPGPAGDAPQAPALVAEAHARAPRARELVGDGAYATRDIAQAAESAGLRPTMRVRTDATLKAKGRPAWPRMVRRARDDPAAYDHAYHTRSNAESTNWAWKHRFGDRLCMRTEIGQDHEIRLKSILHNLGCPPDITTRVAEQAGDF